MVIRNESIIFIVHLRIRSRLLVFLVIALHGNSPLVEKASGGVDAAFVAVLASPGKSSLLGELPQNVITGDGLPVVSLIEWRH